MCSFCPALRGPACHPPSSAPYGGQAAFPNTRGKGQSTPRGPHAANWGAKGKTQAVDLQYFKNRMAPGETWQNLGLLVDVTP